MRVREVLLVAAATLAACHDRAGYENQRVRDQGAKSAAPPSRILDGPFGITQWEALSQITKQTLKVPGVYKLDTVPEPYSGIKYYLLLNTPKFGTCAIKAISDNIMTEDTGKSLKKAIDSVKTNLIRRYGKPGWSFDFIENNSNLTQTHEWMESLSKGKRYYLFYWDASPNVDPNIWRQVAAINLEAHSDGRAGWFVIEYDFQNENNCLLDQNMAPLKAF